MKKIYNYNLLCTHTCWRWLNLTKFNNERRKEKKMFMKYDGNLRWRNDQLMNALIKSINYHIENQEEYFGKSFKLFHVLHVFLRSLLLKTKMMICEPVNNSAHWICFNFGIWDRLKLPFLLSKHFSNWISFHTAFWFFYRIAKLSVLIEIKSRRHNTNQRRNNHY